MKNIQNNRNDKIYEGFMTIKTDFLWIFKRYADLGTLGRQQLLKRLKNVQAGKESKRSKNLNSDRHGR